MPRPEEVALADTRPYLLPAFATDFISAVASSWLGLVVGHPYDTIRVRALTSSSSASLSIVSAVRSLGLRGLYAGIGPPMALAVTVQAISLPCYGALFRRLSAQVDSPPGAPPPVWLHGLAGVLVGPITVPFSTPASVLKIHMQSASAGLAEAHHAIARWGVRALWRGFWLKLACDMVGRGVYLCSYESLKAAFRPGAPAAVPPDEAGGRGGRVLFSESRLPAMLASASLASMAGWSAIFPIDCVGTKFMSQAAAPPTARETALQIARRVYRERGVGGFFVGYRVVLLRAVPVAAVSLPTFELLQRHLARLRVPDADDIRSVRYSDSTISWASELG